MINEPPFGQTSARTILRQWLKLPDDAVIRAVDALGQGAIRGVAAASQRLERSSATSRSSSSVLTKLEALASSWSDSHAGGKRRWFAFAKAPAASKPTLEAVMAELAMDRDVVARNLIVLEADLAKMRDSNGELQAALTGIRDLGQSLQSAIRELSVEQPGRAAFFRDTVVPALLVREQDVLTQMAIVHQGILALELVADGQRALAQGLDRAQSTTVVALRTAIATRSAVEGHREVLEQAQALSQTADAARMASDSRRDVQNALAEAVEQARRAIVAAQAKPGSP